MVPAYRASGRTAPSGAVDGPSGDDAGAGILEGMDQGAGAAQGGHHDPSPPVPATPRERIEAAVRGGTAGRAAGIAGPVPGAPEEPPPRLPVDEGLEPVRRLGAGVWLVRETHSGEPFVLRLCTGGPGPQRERSMAAARAAVIALAGCEGPGLVAVRALVGPAAAPVGLVEDFLSGGSLRDRLAGRGRLPPEEVAEALRDASAGLAVLHGLGRCHGGVTAGRILFRSQGREAALAGVAAEPGAGTRRTEDDVRDLGAVGWTALTGRVPGGGAHRVPLALLCPGAPPAVLAAVEDALAAEPYCRPTAADLAARLDAALAVPASSDGAPQEAPSQRPSRTVAPVSGRGRPRRPLLAGVAALVVAAGGAAAVLGPWEDEVPAPAPRGSTSPAVAPTAGATGEGAGQPAASPGPGALGAPREALRGLVARRGEALRTGDAELLEQVYVPGSAAGAADRRTLEAAARSGEDPFAELMLEVVALDPAAAPPGDRDRGTAAFVARVRVDGYGGDPGALSSVVAAGDGWVQAVEVVLVATEQGWRLGSVAPVADGAAAPGAPDTENPRR